ncbi:MAG TPA: serine acetyltransferase [Acidimicrobiia bacterium]|nr:serine acetyltransferase [Acidimicrobiia bacterium]
MRDRLDRARNARQAARMSLSAPLLLCLRCTDQRLVIEADVQRWYDVVKPDCEPRHALLWFLARYPEFRTLFYYRLRRGNLAGGIAGAALGFVYRGEPTLHLASSEIGPGLFIQHGFATIVAARRLGANCWVNQQVTIGFDAPDERPVLGDGVSVHAGAKILGAVTIGDGARIGANAVVIHDVPAGSTAVGVPARILPPKSERSH